MPTPTPERVRVLLTDARQSAADHDRNGDAFLAEGRANIALMFYERSRSRDRILKILDQGAASGDTFLVEWAQKMLPDLVTVEHWRRTGVAAMGAKKFSFARDAFRKAGDDAAAEEAQKALNQTAP